MITELARFTKRAVSVAQNPSLDGQYQLSTKENQAMLTGHHLDSRASGVPRLTVSAVNGNPVRDASNHSNSRATSVKVAGYFDRLLAKKELKMAICRTFPETTIELHDLNKIQAIDATGVDRIAASQHYANRTNYTFKAV